MFTDLANIYVKAGDGGDGAVSFHREKYIANGGPDGGDGGKGGDIIFTVNDSLKTLVDFRYRRKYKAQPGSNGRGDRCTGKSGDDLVIEVPPGTVIKNKDTGKIIADLVNVDDRVIVAKGGKGGKGNQHFATATRQIPAFAKAGEIGEELYISLELKMLADAGLVGFPNVGKSTILSMVSSATPKIANYHFTTLNPNLGVVSLGMDESFVLADIPGVIEGANEGVGLGHDFLRHIERCKILIHVVDVSGMEGRDPIEDFDKINEEMKLFSPRLAEKYQVVAANKTDLLYDREPLDKFKSEIESRGYKVFEISSAQNKGLKELMYYVNDKLKEIPVQHILENNPDEEVVYTVKDEVPFTIEIIDGIYTVEGSWVDNLVRSTNFTDNESLMYFQTMLRKKGVIDALEEMGIQEGDTVQVENLQFDYKR